MSRPVLKTVSQGLQGWDADINDNFTALWSGPLPIYAAASQPAASSYDDCLMVGTDDHFIRISDGSSWHIIPRQAEAIADLVDDSGGTVATPATIPPVYDLADAADAIAVIAAKVNEILYELRQGKMLKT